MIPEYEEIIAFRLSTRQKKQVELLIEKGKFKNVSLLIRAALTKFLGELTHAS